MDPVDTKKKILSDSSFFKNVVSETELDSLVEQEKPKPEFDKGEINYVI